jgi:lipid-A-disaccharide synthase
MKSGSARWSQSEPLRVFAIAGEHSGDRLGGALLTALRERVGREGSSLIVRGVGAEEMTAAGLEPIFPMSDIAVMGITAVLKRLPLLAERINETFQDALHFEPHAMLIVDSPDFTHRVAKRVRKYRPELPIVDYVSPTVWAWRPGRAKRMAAYVDHVLALLPFEPEAHRRLGGPACTYVGHPIHEHLAWITNRDGAALGRRLGLASGRPVIVVLPGSRRSVIARLLTDFREAVRLVIQKAGLIEIVMPTIAERRAEIEAATADWPVRPHIVTGNDDKFAAFRLARAALAASGTVTLELAAAGTPMVVAYRVESWAVPVLRRMITATTAVLPNHVLGENAFPEFLQGNCTPANLAEALVALLKDGPARQGQLSALAKIPEKLSAEGGSPSAVGADILLQLARHGRPKARAESDPTS